MPTQQVQTQNKPISVAPSIGVSVLLSSNKTHFLSPDKAQHLAEQLNLAAYVSYVVSLIYRPSALEGSPWKEYNFREHDIDRKRITSRQIANLLKNTSLNLRM